MTVRPDLRPDDVEPELERVLLAAAVTGTTDVDTVAAVVDAHPTAVSDHLRAAAERGIVDLEEDRLDPAHRDTVLGTASRAELASLHDAVLDAQIPGGLSIATARGLVASGCRDRRLVDVLLSAAQESVLSDEGWDDEPFELAQRAGASPTEIAALRAHVAAATGDFDLALRTSDVVLSDPSGADLPMAVRAAAVSHAHRGALEHTRMLYDYLGPDALGMDAAFGAWAHLGAGDRDAARGMLDVAGHALPTTVGRSLALVARGLEQSLDGAGQAALPTLVQSATTLRTASRDVIVPESPAALAALVAINCGELSTAEAVLTAAVEADLCGPSYRARHQLLLAWTSMLRGDTVAARERLEAVTAAGQPEMRDILLVQALTVGLARRESDVPALAQAWVAAQESITGHSIDLYSLLALGELWVAAARLRDAPRLRAHLDEADRLLDALGQPPLWSAMYHWCGVQAAILAEEPASLVPHSQALVVAARTSPFAGILAGAGKVWLEMLQERFQAADVQASAAALDRHGLTWDATRLAAQAAARSSDRDDMLTLMQLARSLQRPTFSRGSSEDEAGLRPHLTDREAEVAQLVANGMSYRDIGEKLFISPKTVEHHVARIRRRLGADSRSEMLEVLRSLNWDDLRT
ncbi:helix-turn-helix transcriptional regulator [Aeromicrobium terrae]|uniref:Helix-turn-helix transcriptional regulator n=1 Tax=Aeromicrobium terrae TaxID=2498846 RepID=A0A5C8NDJ6_9ACTN|nr:helix-turn-helix transcriptional regulator [Aeromicrobium terrae]TXL57707.1 helix-turn-helix transcriptional regulator [Aeromicrobium terrae]